MKQIISIAFIFCLISVAQAADNTTKKTSSEIISNKVASDTTSNTKMTSESSVVNKIGIITINTDDCKSGSACYMVATTSNNVLNAVNKGLTPGKTHSLIQTIVLPQFDFTLMTKYAMGNNWKQASATQQKELVNLFQSLLIYTYSSALSGFKGAEISINSVSYRKTTAAVMIKVVLPNTQSNQAINVEYDLAGTTSSKSQTTVWRAYDIKIENASLVTTYRTQFNDIIQSNKVSGLIQQLKNKVASLRTKGNG